MFMSNFTDSVPAFLGYVKSNLVYRYVNKHYAEMLGRSKSEIIGRTVEDVLGSETYRNIRPYLDQVLAGHAVQHELSVNIASLGQRHMDIRYDPDRNKSGAVIGFYVAVLDISDRKRAEEALRASEERYRNLVEGSVQGIVIHKDGRILFANRALADVFGFSSADELIGTSIDQRVAPEDLPRLHGYRAARLRGTDTVSHYEYRGVRKDGSLIWLDNMVQVISWEGEQALQSTLVDITARKLAEEALRKSEAHLAAILDTAGDGIITIDEKGTVQSFNKAAEQMFDYSAGEIIGANVKRLLPLEMAESHDGFLKRYLKTGKSSIIGIGRELTGRRKDGSTFPLFLNVSQVLNGDQVTFTGILSDIGELKRTEQKLIEANKAKSKFLSHMSHELRNPLSTILGFTQLLRQDPELGESQLNDIRIIHSSAQHLLELIDDVLDISKIEAGMEVLQEEDFDLYRNMEGLMDMFSVRASGKGLTLELDVQAGVPQYVSGDRRKLRQVLINLIGNAIKFTEKGGVRVNVSCGAEGIRFQVSDTGPGIRRSDMNRIFEPFRQSERTYSAGGTGLGLSISKSFVDLMGGRLTVDSKENQGSVFAFSLPMERLGEESIEKQCKEKTIMSIDDDRDWRILIVDDDPVNRQYLKNLLDRIGFTTQEAENGAEAIERFKEFTP
ncbi:MAG: PAS domain S-box protein [Planctomycetes bacterium]|nr:PAS domain S-box protein [Planctomycetota bacterium]